MSCFAATSALITGLTLASTQPVVIATDAPFPQYTFVDAAGTITGFERDVMDEVCSRAALSCSWVDTTFDQLIPGVIAGDYDVAIGGVAVTPERRALVDFTISYHGSDDTEWFIGRPGAPLPDAATSAVQAGTVHDGFLRNAGYRTLSFSTEAEVFAALERGEADLAFGPFEGRDDIAALIASKGYDYLYSEVIADEGVAMAVCKGSDLLDSVNAALAAMQADGTLAALEARWFY